jgi:hypothetical protein
MSFMVCTPPGHIYKQNWLFWCIEKRMYVAYIIDHIHPFLNVPKKSNLLINMSGESIHFDKYFFQCTRLITNLIKFHQKNHKFQGVMFNTAPFTLFMFWSWRQPLLLNKASRQAYYDQKYQCNFQDEKVNTGK